MQNLYIGSIQQLVINDYKTPWVTVIQKICFNWWDEFSDRLELQTVWQNQPVAIVAEIMLELGPVPLCLMFRAV